MSKSKVWTDQNAGTAQGGSVEPNKENKEIAQTERLASWKAYAAWIAASEAAGALSGWLSRSGMEFYKAAVFKAAPFAAERCISHCLDGSLWLDGNRGGQGLSGSGFQRAEPGTAVVLAAAGLQFLLESGVF